MRKQEVISWAALTQFALTEQRGSSLILLMLSQKSEGGGMWRRQEWVKGVAQVHIPLLLLTSSFM